MDIFAHGLWAGAAARRLNQIKSEKPAATRPRIRTWAAVFRGVFLDLFAFTPIFIWLFWGLVTGHSHFGEIPQPGPDGLEPLSPDTLPMLRLTHALYSLSHSLITFLVVMGLVWLVRRYLIRRSGTGVYWEMGGWLLHILIDIPTHTYRLYPTPLLWPLSGLKFSGISWGTPWFMLLNYGSLLATYLWLGRRDRKLKPRSDAPHP